jgi:hypothetical protein
MVDPWVRVCAAHEELEIHRLDAVQKREVANKRKTNLDDEAAAVWAELQLEKLGQWVWNVHEDVPVWTPKQSSSSSFDSYLKKMMLPSMRRQMISASRRLCRIWKGPLWQGGNGPHCGFWMDDFIVTHSKAVSRESPMTFSFHSKAREDPDMVFEAHEHPHRTIYNITNPRNSDTEVTNTVVAISITSAERHDLGKRKEAALRAQQEEEEEKDRERGRLYDVGSLAEVILYYGAMDDSLHVLPIKPIELRHQCFWSALYTIVMQGAPILRLTPKSIELLGFVGEPHPSFQQIAILPVIPRKSLHFDWDRVRIRSYLIEIFGRGMDQILLEILAFSTLDFSHFSTSILC